MYIARAFWDHYLSMFIARQVSSIIGFAWLIYGSLHENVDLNVSQRRFIADGLIHVLMLSTHPLTHVSLSPCWKVHDRKRLNRPVFIQYAPVYVLNLTNLYINSKLVWAISRRGFCRPGSSRLTYPGWGIPGRDLSHRGDPAVIYFDQMLSL